MQYSNQHTEDWTRKLQWLTRHYRLYCNLTVGADPQRDDSPTEQSMSKVTAHQHYHANE